MNPRLSLENSIHLFNKKSLCLFQKKMLVIAVIVVVIVILIYTGWYSNLGSGEREFTVYGKSGVEHAIFSPVGFS